MHVRRRYLSTVSAVIAVLAVQLVGAPTAQASVTAGVTTNIYACTDQGAAGCKQVLSTIPAGATVTMNCWYDAGAAYTGLYSSPRWFVVSYNGTGGWVHSSYVTVASQTSVGWCGNIERYMAAWRASRWYGQIIANSTVISWFKPPVTATNGWLPGVDGGWSGDCVKLGVSAYLAAGNRRIASGSSAYNQYLNYLNAGKIKQGVPNIGALVFYGKTNGNPYGHVAVYAGGGKVITTVGAEPASQSISGKPNAFAPYATGGQSGAYLGWALP